jgi:pimeloyl-ACP methyl ester carboxylesterase
MRKQLLIHNKKVTYTDQGKGKTIVLLHGYLESLEIWEPFTSQLVKKYHVLCFDIPGHGESETISERHSIETLVETLSEALQQLDVKKCFMVGHSMGGYVALMFHKLFPEKLIGFSLFHSHPFADSEETKKKRKREISLVQDGKKDLIAKVNIPNAFADENLEKFKKDVDIATEIALKTPANGIIANLYAMMNRPDLSESLANTNLPFLFIVGEKDNYIDFNSIIPKVKLPEYSKLCILKNSGHMGFLEEKVKSFTSLTQFIDSI